MLIKFLILGIVLALISVGIAASFIFIDNHKWYWNIAPLYSLIVILGAFLGGYSIAYSLKSLREKSIPYLVASAGFLGIVLGVLFFISGIFAWYTACGGMHQLSSDTNVPSYTGDYMVYGFGILALQLCFLLGILAGFLICLAFKKVKGKY